jgi:ABC-2 type transport system ATP-binding protein
VDDTLARLGLTKRQDQLAGALSGGWKQRMALAACMLHDPKLLLLDEPTAGVDPKARRDFWEEIHALSAEGLTVLVSTHYMDEAERCDRIVYILNGKLVARGSVAEVIEESGLSTFVIEGKDVRKLERELQDKPGVDYAGFFGAALHASGRDRAALEKAVAPYRGRAGLTVTEVKPNLEDVFIQLQEQTQEQTGEKAK